MDIKDIQEILKVIQGTDVEEIELTRGGETIRIKRGVPSSQAHNISVNSSHTAPSASGVVPLSNTGAALTPQISPPVAPPPIGVQETRVTVNSPFVGTFYRSSTPGAPPFVEMGTKVRKGQVLCVVEAMKLMNEIEAEVSGTIVSILKEDGKPVEFGEPLFLIGPDEGSA